LWIAIALGSIAVVAWTTTVAVGGHGHTADREPAVGGPQSGIHPNLLVVTTDDQTASQFMRRAMPFTRNFFKRRGSMFSNSLAVPPLCCPDRAGFLTGEYPQNHGVLTNEGGYSYLKQKENTLPVWLGRAGYRTGLVGKYLNDYPVLGGVPAPGWDKFFAAGGETIGYRDFDVGANGVPRHYDESRYSTDVYTHAAERFMQGAERSGQPFFLWLTYHAPHIVPEGSPPCPGASAQPESTADYRRVAGVPLPEDARRQEVNVSDKGPWVSQMPPISSHRFRYIHKKWRCALASLLPVDRGIRSIVHRLRRHGELNRTIIVFTSDNGFFYGEHRIPADKKLPYEPSLRVPLAISVPPGTSRGPRPQTIPSLVSNVDLAPTLLDYAHARSCKNPGRCRTIDGHSLRPLLDGTVPEWTRNRALPIELDEDFVYKALRTPRLLFMRLVSDRTGPLAHPDFELYDLRTDPSELHNLWTEDGAVSPSRKRRLVGRLQRLTHCAGTHGRPACP
jgi:N-acetylglucosamine-6-sulfatase